MRAQTSVALRLSLPFAAAALSLFKKEPIGKQAKRPKQL